MAVIRISGPDAVRILQKVFHGPSPIERPRRARLGRVIRESEVVDQALAVFFPGPHSYTGEDMAELHGHGGVHVAAEVLGAVLDAGARLARPGEFTERAFLNGKMDLTQAEAVMDIIRARTPASLRAAQQQMEGALGRLAMDLRSRLLGLVANLEAWIDFPEEDIEPEAGEALASGFRRVMEEVDRLLETARTGRIYREGASLVLWGEPNAGKSSLLNCLLGCERAIVAPTPGTTRDTIEESLNLGGILFRVTDTAGLRESADQVEALGMARTHRALAGADIAVRVVDASAPARDLPSGFSGASAGLVALNKCDLLPQWPENLPPGHCAISCQTGQGVPELVEAILKQVGFLPGQPAAAAINARHQNCLRRVREALGRALRDHEAGQPAEFVASSAREALEALGEMCGVADTEEILGEIFSRFCIGK